MAIGDDSNLSGREAEVKVWVQPYYRHDGTRVPGHYRTLRSVEASPPQDAREAPEQNLTALEQQEAELELLEKASALKKRQRKYQRSDSAETWVSRWIASPIAYLFPPERREEWLGDLYELNREMLHKGYPRWLISVINIGRTVILILSAIQIKLSDIISLGVKRSP